MTAASLVTIYASLFLAALAGSLHCIGMCGPLIAGFSQGFTRLTIDGRDAPQRSTLWADMALYHAGRIWTYAFMGWIAGWLGGTLHHGSTYFGWQRPASVVLSAAVLVSGVALLGVIPGLKLDGVLGGCGRQPPKSWAWLHALVASRSAVARLLLGAIMGLLPCGLVYAMLVTVAALPSPMHAALGMAIFGIGTVPSLSAVLIATRAIPMRWRANATRVAAMIVLLTGAWMLTRTFLAHDHHPTPPTGTSTPTESGEQHHAHDASDSSTSVHHH